MAINVSYQPPASVIYGAASAYGRRQFDRERDQLRLAYDKMALDDLQQRRGIEANLYSQAANRAFQAQQQGMDRRFRWGLTNQQAQLDRAFKREDRDFLAEHQLQRDKMGFEQQRERDMFLQEQDAAQQEAHDMRMNESAMQRQDAMLDRSQWIGEEQSLRMDEDDYRRWVVDDSKMWAGGKVARDQLAELNSTIASVKADENLNDRNKQAKLRELYGKRWDLIRNPPPLEPNEVPKTPDQMYDEETIERVGKDGKTRRYQRIVSPQGGAKWEEIGDPEGGLSPEDLKDIAEVNKMTKKGGDKLNPTEEPLSVEEAMKELDRRRKIRAAAAGKGIEVSPTATAAPQQGPSQAPSDIVLSPDNPAVEGPTRRVSGGAYGQGAEIDAKGRRIERPTPPPPPPVMLPDGTLQEVPGGLPVIMPGPEGEKRLKHLLELSPVVTYINAKTGKYIKITRQK